MRKIKSDKYENLKMEAASEVGIDVNEDIKSKEMSAETTSIGGRMVKKMIEDMKTE